MQRRLPLAIFASLVFALLPNVGYAAEVLRHLPPDALGFVMAQNMAATDAKLQRLLGGGDTAFIGPLAFFQAATGIDEGLDAGGDFLLAVLPGEAQAGKPTFCVWLPVNDYDRFVVALDSKPAAAITAVTIRGVDLLVTRQGQWALIMDPDQRDRLQRMLAAPPTPASQLAAWQTWIESNDVTAVVLPGGVRRLLTWATASGPDDSTSAHPSDELPDDLFAGDDANADVPPNQRTNPAELADPISKIRHSLRQVLTASPKALQWAHAIETMACGVRLDNDGNLLSGIRAAWKKDGRFNPDTAESDAGLPPSMNEGRQFVLRGAGKLPQPLTAVLAGAYVRLVVDELKTEMALPLEPKTVIRFQEAVEQAAASVPAAGVLTLAGDKQDGVYTNNFLIARVESAATFADQANEVMRLWNQMNREAEQGTRLVFDVEQRPMGDRTATLYSLDVAAADGAPAIPEIREVMEKFFGPGGKLQLIIVPADDHHVLLAMATPQQVERALNSIGDSPSDWDGGEQTDPANELLVGQRDWRLFFSPHGYTTWLTRYTDAMTGPVFGGPLVRDFPVSPVIGVAGGARDHELWIDLAAPAATVKNAAAYFEKKR